MPFDNHEPLILGEANPARSTLEQLARQRDWDARGKMLAERVRSLAVALGAKHHRLAVRLMELSRLVAEGCVLGRRSVKTSLDDIRPELELIAATEATESAQANQSEPVGKRVVQYLARFQGDGGDVLTLTRDGIAKAISASPAAVSGTKAWKGLCPDEARVTPTLARHATHRQLVDIPTRPSVTVTDDGAYL